MPTIVLIVISLCALTGIVMLVLGVCGRRMDDHRLCRKCRYDLTGVKAPGACPECGADVTGPRAVRIGHRRRRPVIATFGALLLLVGLGGGGYVGYLASEDFDWNTVKPVWMLRMDLRSPDAQVSDEAMSELLRRLQASALGPDTITSMVDELLVRHADPNASWSDSCSEFIEIAHAQGDLDEERFLTYLQQAMTSNLTLEVADLVRRGQPVAYRVSHGPIRLSYQFQTRQRKNEEVPTYIVGRSFRELRLGDEVLADLRGVSGTSWVSAGRGSMGSSRPLDLEPGTHTLVIDVLIQLYRAPRYEYATLESKQDPVRTMTITLQDDVTVVPEDETVIRLIDDPSLERAIREALIIEMIDEKVMVGTMSHSYEAGRGFIGFHQPPVNVSFDMFARTEDGREVFLESRYAEKDKPASWGWLATPIRETLPDERMIDVIFRTNVEVAERTIDIREVWDGAFIVHDVPLVDEARAADADEEQ